MWSYCKFLMWCCMFLDGEPLRFGRPGVECYCQHESGAAVIQLQFLINEVSYKILTLLNYAAGVHACTHP